ncbi:MAG: DUF87 domain-containing protein [Cyanobacteria bacterium P01_A01_bin.105]
MTAHYEQLGKFYLGKACTLPEGERLENLVLYDSQDLTTHAMIVGMTGSGKTGLGLALLEEALMDHIPLIAIDPKGDLANLLLTFEDLTAENFLPWVDAQAAATQGLSTEDYAQAQAELWEKGLAQWDQTPDRIKTLRRQVEMAVYTPGSTAGQPISVLRSFDVPPEAVMADGDLRRDRIKTTVTSLLALLGMTADPVTSREHILLANILNATWQAGNSIDLAGLIQTIQAPPFERIGVLDLDQFYPAKDRFALAMQLNNLLAAPGFETWLQGDPLDIQTLLYTAEGQPRAAVISIAHLSDRERMFFVTMLLNALLGWMRTQSGTGSLRALLYMDEIFGYLPPVANPPSKLPLLTLLKQARAFGVGLVLSTQNPVDLDYKALSNMGTWFIGRLQTERDKARLIEGLQGTSPTLETQELSTILSGLGKRTFLLHNVHEDRPVLFQTRWVMSYLCGPMTRDQIKRLTALQSPPPAASPPTSTASAPPAPAAPAISTPAKATAAPILPDTIQTYVLPTAAVTVEYRPALVLAADLYYTSKTYNVEETRPLVLAAPLLNGPVLVDWEAVFKLSLAPADLELDPVEVATFADLPTATQKETTFNKLQKDFLRHLRQRHVLQLYRSKSPKLIGRLGESKSSFLARLRQHHRELRDQAVTKLQQRYASKLKTAENKLLRAERAIERETAQVRQQQMDSAIAIGSTVLGAFMGRKITSRRNVNRAGRAMRSAGRISQSSMDVQQAQEKANLIRDDIITLEAELQDELAVLEEKFSGELVADTVTISAKSTNITLHLYGFLWLPYAPSADGTLAPAW